jgi:hypothetical protein
VQTKAIEEKAACELRTKEKQENAKIEEAKKGAEDVVMAEELKEEEQTQGKLSQKIDPKNGELDEVPSGSPNRSHDAITETEKEETKPEPEQEE